MHFLYNFVLFCWFLPIFATTPTQSADGKIYSHQIFRTADIAARTETKSMELLGIKIQLFSGRNFTENWFNTHLYSKIDNMSILVNIFWIVSTIQ